MTDILKRIEVIKQDLKNILKDNGYSYDYNSLTMLIKAISKMQIINPNKEYYGVQLTDEYITNVVRIDSVIEDVPSDVFNSCYILDSNNKPLLDEEKKLKILLGGKML